MNIRKSKTTLSVLSGSKWIELGEVINLEVSYVTEAINKEPNAVDLAEMYLGVLEAERIIASANR